MSFFWPDQPALPSESHPLATRSSITVGMIFGDDGTVMVELTSTSGHVQHVRQLSAERADAIAEALLSCAKLAREQAASARKAAP